MTFQNALFRGCIFSCAILALSAWLAWQFDSGLTVLYENPGPWNYVRVSIRFDFLTACVMVLIIPLGFLLRRRFPAALLELPVLAFAILTFVVAAVVKIWVFADYDLNVDEYMTAIQARMFLNGDLMAPIPVGYTDLARALLPYMTNYDLENGYWGVYYLPVFAALRAGASLIATDALLNPALAAVSVLALASISRKLWPEDKHLPAIACLLLVSSPQFLLSATTGFSFSAHLAFNLLWLRLVLAGSNRAHVAAALLGFFLIGMHRPHVHLLFAFPFVAAFVFGWQGRTIRTSVLYGVIYSAGLYVWLSWADWSNAVATGDWSMMSWNPLEFRALGRYQDLSSYSHGIFESNFRYSLMNVNFMRLSAWLNPAVLVLFLVGSLSWRALSATERIILLSVASTILPYTFLMPNPSIGWGYRFGIPAVGSMVLVACMGFRGIKDRPAVSGMVAALTVFALAVQLPHKVWQMANVIRPNAAAAARIAEGEGEIVLLDNLAFSNYHVRNDPYLTNRPILVALHYLSVESGGALCAKNEALRLVGVDADSGLLDRSEMLEIKKTRETVIAGLQEQGCKIVADQ